MLVTSARVGGESWARAVVGTTELVGRRGPALLTLGTRATIGIGETASKAQSEFRDELLTLFDDAAEIGWRQARRAREELGVRTTPREPRAALATNGRQAAVSNGAPPRRHRVKP
jgi:hypothetical protein